MLTVRVASFGGVSALPIRAAQAQGLFDKADIDVQHSVTRSSADLRSRLAERSVSVIHLAPDNVISWADESMGVRAWLAGSNGPISLLGMGVVSVEELRGRRIGVDSASSGFVTILGGLLERHGIATADVELAPLGATRLRYSALLEGEIAATMLTLPWARLAERQGGVTLADHHHVVPGLLTSCAASLEDWLAAERLGAMAYADALFSAIDWLRNSHHRQRAGALLAADLGIDQGSAQEVVAIMADPGVGWPAEPWLSATSLAPALTLRAQTMGAAAGSAEAYISRPGQT